MVDRDTPLVTRRLKEKGETYISLDDLLVNLETIAMVYDAEGREQAAHDLRVIADSYACNLVE